MVRARPPSLTHLAPVVLRMGMALLFLWFGISQLVNPASFLGYVPSWLSSYPPTMNHDHPLVWLHEIKGLDHWVIMANGLFETVFGALLLLGIGIRWVAGLLALHLLGIAASLGYNDIMIRDLALVFSCVSVALHGPDDYTAISVWKRYH